MALLFFDGFDGYDSTADHYTYGKWYSINSVYTNSTSTRLGTGKCVHIGGTQFPLKYYLGADKYNTTLYIGAALKLLSPFVVDTLPIIALLDSVNNYAVWIGFDYLVNKFYYHNGSTKTYTTSTFTVDTWYYVELKIKPHTSTGDLILKVNENEEINVSGVDVIYSGNNVIHYLQFMSSVNTGLLIDDVYLCDSTGSINNTFLGEVVCKQYALSGDSSVQFTRNTGATNYQAVDEILGAPNDTTDYVYSSTSGHRDEYTLPNTSQTDTIFGVKVNVRAQKDTANPRSLKYGIKTGSDQRETTATLGIGYANYESIHETYDGSNQWTTTKLDDAVATLEVV